MLTLLICQLSLLGVGNADPWSKWIQ